MQVNLGAKFIAVAVLALNLNASGVFTPITSEHDYDERKASLGKMLFFDTRISQKHYSCATCHHLKVEFTGTSNVVKPHLNPPTVLNAALNYLFGHEGKVETLKDQFNFTLTGVDGLESSPEFIVEKVRKNPKYRGFFDELYSDGVTFENIKDALSEFLKALLTPSAFDRYLLGDKTAMSQEQIAGMNIFVKKGCPSCHNGVNLGGNMVSKFVGLDGKLKSRKVPTLRNILRTGPYMHNGMLATLRGALNSLNFMTSKLVDTEFSDEEFESLMKFFEALNGKVPEILNE